MNDIKDIFHPTIYIVMFATGEYEDYREDTLGFFLHKEDAKTMITKLKKEYSNWDDKTYEENDEFYSAYHNQDYTNNKTIAVSIDYTGPEFYIRELENIRNLL